MPTRESPACKPVTGTLVTTPVAPLSKRAMSLPLVAYNNVARAGRAARPNTSDETNSAIDFRMSSLSVELLKRVQRAPRRHEMLDPHYPIPNRIPSMDDRTG